MTTTVSPVVAANSSRAIARGRLLGLFERPELPIGIVVGRHKLKVWSNPWDVFWKPVLALRSAEVANSLSACHCAWDAYLRSGFRLCLARDYCYRYFSLLAKLITLCQRGAPDGPRRAALRTALGFECVALFGGDLAKPAAAVTTTLRNPCYLLAKLKHVGALDDPQFLPLITLPQCVSARLFYHYRRHKLSTDSDLSLMLYLNPDHLDSFPVINTLEARVSSGADPRADERAARIARGIVIPYLRKANGIAGASLTGDCDIEFVDLGCGSGILVAKLCQIVKGALRGGRRKLRFRAYLLDLAPNNPMRFFRASQIRDTVDSLTCISADYRDWLEKPGHLPKRTGVRLTIVSRFFNNLSSFGIATLRPKRLAQEASLSHPDSWWPVCLPSKCLGPAGPGPGSLITSNRRLWLTEGRTFVQASLSDFVKGLHLVLKNDQPGSSSAESEDGVFLPLRCFRPTCLLTSSGTSVLGGLLSDCSLIVINDADVRPKDLKAHVDQAPIPGSMAIDMTRSLGLKGHFTCAIGRADDPAAHSLKGRRLW